jgi:hypothetical protein
VEANNPYQNNSAIMDNINTGAKKLELVINEDEMVISSKLLSNSKMVTLCGNRLAADDKRYS